MTDFRPGRPLPSEDRSTRERLLSHAQRQSGKWTSMARESSSWQWLSEQVGSGHLRRVQRGVYALPE